MVNMNNKLVTGLYLYDVYIFQSCWVQTCVKHGPLVFCTRNQESMQIQQTLSKNYLFNTEEIPLKYILNFWFETGPYKRVSDKGSKTGEDYTTNNYHTDCHRLEGTSLKLVSKLYGRRAQLYG